MIPKIIHYCWYGKNEMSPLSSRCMDSWKVFAPDYKIKKWDESNSFFRSPAFDHAKKHKQWAFMSDIVRLYILFEHGGMYLDVDMEIVKPFKDLSKKSNFIIGEESELVNCAIIISQPRHPLIKKMIDCLEDHQKKTSEFIPIPNLVDPVVREWSQTEIFIAPKDYFYPYNPYDRERKVKQLMFSDIKNTTYTIHHYQKSWRFSFLDLLRSKLRALLRRTIYKI